MDRGPKRRLRERRHKKNAMTGRLGWWPGMAGPPRVLPRSAVEGPGKAGRSSGARGAGRGHGVAVVAVPLVTMGWLASHAPAPAAPSLAQVVCMAKVPVASVRSNDPP